MPSAEIPAHNILISGASGMLGGCLLRQAATVHHVEGTGNEHCRAGLIRMDLTREDSVREVIARGRYSHIIHCAALRSPDYCLEHRAEAEAVNAKGTRLLAEAARDSGTSVIYISTDYVFSGDNPPYRENSPVCPVNLYGQTKARGEEAVEEVEKHLIVRIPALYRTDLDDDGSVVTAIYKELQTGKTLSLDQVTVRYYTLADDIAAAVIYCLEYGTEGIIHLSATEKTTKADFARAVAVRLGFPEDKVQGTEPPATGDARPHDSHLASDRYETLQGPRLRPFTEILEGLQPLQDS